jgi:hypothetical protein
MSTGWHHLMVTYDGTTMLMYIDGVAQAPITITLDTSINNASGTGTFGIGKAGYAPFDGPPGDMDEIGVWARCITPAEVTYLYNSGAGKAYPL